MDSNLKFTTFDTSNTHQFETFYKIYYDSIEKSEQKPKEKIQQLCQRSDYLIRLLYSESELNGFTLSYLNFESQFALLEYMAVDQSKRSAGYGTDLLNDLAAELQKKKVNWLAMEVDSPYQSSADQKNRIRRVEFYKRNRAREVEGLNYILPLPNAPADLEMKILLRQIQSPEVDVIDTQSLKNMIQSLYVNVYSCEPTDPRLKRMFSDLPKALKLKERGASYV